MKKLNITKKQYMESKYFNKKYGALKYMAESKKNVFKTDKGVVIALEGTEMKEDPKSFPPPEKAKQEKLATEAEEDAEVVGAEEGEVTRGELTEMLKDVVAAVKEVADSQDVPVEEVIGAEEEDDEDKEEFDESDEDDGVDADEVVATKEEVADVLAKVIDTVQQVADKADVELPVEIVPAEDDGEGDEAEEEEVTIDEGEEEVCPKCGQPLPKKECCAGGKCEEKECCGKACECGGEKTPAMESRKARLRKIRESVRRHARAKMIRESIKKHIRARKVAEAVKRHRATKRLVESAKRRAHARKMMESRKVASKRVARRAR